MSFIFHETDGGNLRFVGDFDSLYRTEADPWGQSGQGGDLASYYRLSRNRLSEVVGRLHAGERLKGIEIGCGHGFALRALAAAVPGQWSGLDISSAAIAKALELHPCLQFYAGDIAGPLPFPPSYVGKYDVAILSQILWYILEKLDVAVANTMRLVRAGGLVVISQAFLKGEQRYGSDIAAGFDGTLRLFMERYRGLGLIEAHYDDSSAHAHHDGLLIFRKVFANAQ